jgi:hypothetical protein
VAEAHFAEYSSSTMIIRDGIIVRAMSEGGNLRQHQGQARIARSLAIIGGSNFGGCPEELARCLAIVPDHLVRRTIMKLLLIPVAVLSFALSSASADAKGCIKGAIVGGVAGHMAGHGKLGAAAGCAVGHHEANKSDPNKANAQAPSNQK